MVLDGQALMNAHDRSHGDIHRDTYIDILDRSLAGCFAPARSVAPGSVLTQGSPPPQSRTQITATISLLDPDTGERPARPDQDRDRPAFLALSVEIRSDQISPSPMYPLTSSEHYHVRCLRTRPERGLDCHTRHPGNPNSRRGHDITISLGQITTNNKT